MLLTQELAGQLAIRCSQLHGLKMPVRFCKMTRKYVLHGIKSNDINFLNFINYCKRRKEE